MKNVKVLIIGESCVDEFIYCETHRLSPEAPVPVLNPVKSIKNNGMSGNTKDNVTSLLKECDITLLTQKEVITKTRYVENKSNHMFLRVDKGEDKISPINLTDDICNKIKNSDIVIISDYNKGFLSDEDIKRIGTLSRLSIIDSKRELTEEMVSNHTFIKLNENESRNNKDLNHKGLITTLGARGAKHNGKIYPSPNPQETIDVSGAGDTFTASFIVSYHQTRDISLAIIEANSKASDVVSRRGVVVPNK